MKAKFKRRFLEQISFGGGLKVDRDKGIIYSVKILGFDSQNGRRYLPEAVRNAKPLYEGVLVNIDHPKSDPSDQRSAYDRFGKLVNVKYVEGKGLFGDLVYLTTHPMAKRVVEAAERMPEAFGMSHNAQGEGDKEDGIFVVHAISEVRHVDLVADPATTKSLSEGVMSKKSVANAKSKNSVTKRKLVEADYKEEEKEDAEDGEIEKRDLKDMILDILDGEGESKDKADAIEALMKESDEKDSMEEVEEAEDSEEKETKEEEEETKEEEEKEKTTESKVSKLSKRLKTLQEQVDRSNKEKKIRELCESVSLSASKDLLEDLMSMPNEVAVRHAKRLAIAYKSAKPKSGLPTLEGVEAKFPSGLELGAYLSN